MEIQNEAHVLIGFNFWFLILGKRTFNGVNYAYQLTR